MTAKNVQLNIKSKASASKNGVMFEQVVWVGLMSVGVNFLVL